MNNRFPSFYLLGILCIFSMFQLNGVQAAILFFLISLMLGILTHRKDVMITPVVFIIVAYTLAFPLPMLFPGLYPGIWSKVSPQALEYGMLWALRGFGAFALGYVLVEQFGRRVRKQNWQDGATARAGIRYTVYVLTCIGWLAILAWAASVLLFGISLTFIEGDSVRADSGAGTLQQVINLLTNLRYPFLLGFMILHFWKKTDKHLILLCAALVLVTLVEIVVMGSKASIIRVVVVLLLGLAFIPVRLNLKQILVGLLALIATYGSFSVITEYRSIMQTERLAGRDVFAFKLQAVSFREAVIASLPFSESSVNRRTVVDRDNVLSRFSAGIYSFAHLMEFTGRRSPYEHAWESFLIPVYSVAPRALVPEKPEFFNAGRYAKEYYGWSYGGISVSLLGSLYYAWGYTGIILGMAFAGCLFAYAARQTGIYSPHWLIFLVILTLPMLEVGDTFHAIATNFIRVAVLLWLLHILFPLVRGVLRRRMSRILSQSQREVRA